MSSTLWPFPSGLLPALQKRVASRIGRWARKRQGEDPVTTRLQPRRIYILPTAIGLLFGLMAFAMLLGSMNYNNNLSFVLTFVLVGIGLVSMHQCQRNLVGLELTFAGTEPVFAGQTLQFRVAINNPSRSTRYGVHISRKDVHSDSQDLLPGQSKIFLLPVATESRGWIKLDRFSIRTRFPFQLFRSWAWLHMNLTGLVYPCPAAHPPEPPPSMVANGHRHHDARGEEDFAGLRKYTAGDSPRHIAWKAYARNGQLLAKQFSGADTSSQWFEFSDLQNADTETRLSILTSWVVRADRTLEDYGLRIPGLTFEPGHGDEHRRRCLEALAVYRKEIV